MWIRSGRGQEILWGGGGGAGGGWGGVGLFFFFKQKTAYEIGTGDWSSDVCSSDLIVPDGFLDAPFCYGEDESRIKTKAIKAHISQHERPAAIGSYTSADSRDYATIANERSADLARIMRSQLPFAERYVLSHPDLDKETLITALWDFQKC